MTIWRVLVLLSPAQTNTLTTWWEAALCLCVLPLWCCSSYQHQSGPLHICICFIIRDSMCMDKYSGPDLSLSWMRLYSNSSPTMLRCPQRYNTHPCIRPLRRGLLVTTHSIDFFSSPSTLKAPSLLWCYICPFLSPWGQWPRNTS